MTRRLFGRQLKRLCLDRVKRYQSSSFKINSEICTDNKQIGASFNSFFTETVSRLVQLIGAEASLLFRSPKKTITTDKTSQTFKFAEISEFVHKKLKSLKTNKASGLDQLSPRLMKDSSSLIAKPLALIMNYSIAQGSVPLDWKASKVSPLYKVAKLMIWTIIAQSLFLVFPQKYLKERSILNYVVFWRKINCLVLTSVDLENGIQLNLQLFLCPTQFYVRWIKKC